MNWLELDKLMSRVQKDKEWNRDLLMKNIGAYNSRSFYSKKIKEAKGGLDKEVGLKVLENFKEKLPEYFTDMKEDEKPSKNKSVDTEPPSNDTAMEIIKQLVLNNAHLCRSNENLSAGNLKQTVMMENIVSSGKEEESRLTQLIQARIIKLLAAQGVGDKWKSLEEGIEVLGKYLFDALIPSIV